MRLGSEVGVDLRALRRAVAELRLDRLEGLATGGGLTGYRVAADLMMGELAQPESPLHCAERPLVAVEMAREGAVAREEKLVSRVAVLDVPANGVDDVGRQCQRQGLVWLLFRGPSMAGRCFHPR